MDYQTFHKPNNIKASSNVNKSEKLHKDLTTERQSQPVASTAVQSARVIGAGIDGSLSIRTSPKKSDCTSLKRDSIVIDLLSSDDEEISQGTPKRPRRSVASSPETEPLKKCATHHLKAPKQLPTEIVSHESQAPVGKGLLASYRHHDVHDEAKHSSLPSPTNRPAHSFSYVAIPTREAKGITPTDPDAVAQRHRFLSKLAELRGPKVSVVNELDQSSPSIQFQFVNDSILGRGVLKAPKEVMIGCTCRKDNGRNIGCEYLSCNCLHDSANNDNGNKVFPYSAAKNSTACLREFYLQSRHHIFECNDHCNCNLNCKNRNVQHGRRVELEIFKTQNRGWGLRCPVDLRKGDFIDTYRGEIITAKEANERGDKRSADEENYFMNFDKFTEPQIITKAEFMENFPDKVEWHAKKVRDDDWDITYSRDGEEMWRNPDYVDYLYVCDGMHIGGPTRFMNHSCDPNCRLFTVSYNHSDENLYELAFFTLDAIPAGTELTFDYKDEDDRSIITDDQALEVKRRDGYMPQKCLCGTPLCRRYFFN
ncbi:MAG: hypothetical protein LQ344_005532 [Seirophora lacunosa]|nr:MAG: hypothetical protein LQ344_005532 [Seirophora lacunosa]